jgi:hypothetical protein
MVNLEPAALDKVFQKLTSQLTFDFDKNYDLIRASLLEAFELGSQPNLPQISKIETHFLECDCHADEHTLKYTLHADSNYPDLTTSIYLHDWRPWYKKLWTAIKYLCGYACRYGHWDTFHLQAEDAPKLINLLERYNSLCQHRK